MQIKYKGGQAVFIKEGGLVNRQKQLRAYEQFIRALRRAKIAYQITSI